MTRSVLDTVSHTASGTRRSRESVAVADVRGVGSEPSGQSELSLELITRRRNRRRVRRTPCLESERIRSRGEEATVHGLLHPQDILVPAHGRVGAGAGLARCVVGRGFGCGDAVRAIEQTHLVARHGRIEDDRPGHATHQNSSIHAAGAAAARGSRHAPRAALACTSVAAESSASASTSGAAASRRCRHAARSGRVTRRAARSRGGTAAVGSTGSGLSRAARACGRLTAARTGRTRSSVTRSGSSERFAHAADDQRNRRRRHHCKIFLRETHKQSPFVVGVYTGFFP